jgi:hypothetical protein
VQEVDCPGRTGDGPQVHELARRGTGVSELMIWHWHLEPVPGMTSSSLLHTPPGPT